MQKISEWLQGSGLPLRINNVWILKPQREWKKKTKKKTWKKKTTMAIDFVCRFGLGSEIGFWREFCGFLWLQHVVSIFFAFYVVWNIMMHSSLISLIFCSFIYFCFLISWYPRTKKLKWGDVYISSRLCIPPTISSCNIFAFVCFHARVVRPAYIQF